MSPTEIERGALSRIKQIVREELKTPPSVQTKKHIASILRAIAFEAEAAAQDIEGPSE